jgi:DNA-binding transcriptional MerR regulator
MSARKGYKPAEVCKQLDLQPYVLRYWETEFAALHPAEPQSGPRLYTEPEVALIRRIKQLLYEEGYTIAGAKKKLESDPGLEVRAAPVTAGLFDAEAEESVSPPEEPAPKPAASKRPSAGAARAKEPEQLDTDSAERIERLHRGVEEALAQARAVLALLDKNSR